MLSYGRRRRLLVYDSWRRQVLDLKTRRWSFSATLGTDCGFLIQIQAFWYRFIFILYYIWYRFRLLDTDLDILETHMRTENHPIWYKDMQFDTDSFLFCVTSDTESCNLILQASWYRFGHSWDSYADRESFNLIQGHVIWYRFVFYFVLHLIQNHAEEL